MCEDLGLSPMPLPLLEEIQIVALIHASDMQIEIGK